MRVSRAARPDFPRGDARQEEYSVIFGAVIDGWIVVQCTTGAASPDLIGQIAMEEGRRLLAARTPPGGQ